MPLISFIFSLAGWGSFFFSTACDQNSDLSLYSRRAKTGLSALLSKLQNYHAVVRGHDQYISTSYFQNPKPLYSWEPTEHRAELDGLLKGQEVRGTHRTEFVHMTLNFFLFSLGFPSIAIAFSLLIWPWDSSTKFPSVDQNRLRRLRLDLRFLV